MSYDLKQPSIIVCYTPDGGMKLYGTKTKGDAFWSEKSAHREMRRLQRAYPSCEFEVVNPSPLPKDVYKLAHL